MLRPRVENWPAARAVREKSAELKEAPHQHQTATVVYSGYDKNPVSDSESYSFNLKLVS